MGSASPFEKIRNNAESVNVGGGILQCRGAGSRWLGYGIAPISWEIKADIVVGI